jgi:hypothetical protein
MLTNALTPKELSRRWRCRPSFVRALIRQGTLAAIAINGRPRILPEAIAAVEQGALSVGPARQRRRREVVPAEVAAMLAD